MDEHDEMLDAHRAREDSRRAAMGELGAQVVEGLHGPRDAAASALAAARGAFGAVYERVRGPRTLEEAREMNSAIEAPRHHARGRGSNE